jgi:hypothetical protein
MSRRRAMVAAGAVVGSLGLVLGACGSSDDGSGSTTTTAAKGSTTTSTTSSPPISGVAAPVVLTPSQTTATVPVGATVVFDMGDPKGGSFVADSDAPAVFAIEGEGKVEGTMTTNAGGKALKAGIAHVTVSFHGSTNGVGTPTEFTITVA